MLLGSPRKPEEMLDKDQNIRSDLPMGKAVFSNIIKKSPLFGVTRTGNISHLQKGRLAIWQSARPLVYGHFSCGNNTGSQGKAKGDREARLKCLMESVEGYCAEPRDLSVIRGSYHFLKAHYPVVPPTLLKSFWLRPFEPRAINAAELAWSAGIELFSRKKVWLPAETIYFPFFAHDFKTKPYFRVSSNGQASSVSYLLAMLTALYEAYERALTHLPKSSGLRVCGLYEKSLPLFDTHKFREARREFDFRVGVLCSDKHLLVPVVVAYVSQRGQKRVYFGSAAAATLNRACEKAIFEALQSQATDFSGAREDLEPDIAVGSSRHLRPIDLLPKKRELNFKEAQRFVRTLNTSTTQEEYESVMAGLKSLGAKFIFAANLTRVGLEIPSVKVLLGSLLEKTPIWPSTDKGIMTPTSFTAQSQLGYIERSI